MTTTTSRLQFHFHEQRKIEKLLVKLAKLKPISAKPAPIMTGSSTTTANNA